MNDEIQLKKKIYIKFVDFWEHWNQESNFLIDVLKQKYDVVFSDTPDYIFYSNFNDNLNHMDYNNCIKIFYTQENICPDFNFADYGIGFELLTFGDRYLRYPIYLVSERYKKAWELMVKKHIIIPSEKEKMVKRNFCSFVVSNGNADTIRESFFDLLLSYKKVNSGGRYLNNIGEKNGVKDKIVFESNHKFSLCFENSSHLGYTTEKLIEAFAARTVPIYWGDPTIATFFSDKSFININNFETLDEALKYIIKVDEDDDLYFKMLESAAVIDANLVWEEEQKKLEEFLYNIFDQEQDVAYRRNMVFWGRKYCDNIMRMRKFYVDFMDNKILKLLIAILRRMSKLVNKIWIRRPLINGVKTNEK